jgi:hypothetical protein
MPDFQDETRGKRALFRLKRVFAKKRSEFLRGVFRVFRLFKKMKSVFGLFQEKGVKKAIFNHF